MAPRAYNGRDFPKYPRTRTTTTLAICRPTAMPQVTTTLAIYRPTATPQVKSKVQQHQVM